MHRWVAALAGHGTREIVVGTVGAVATGMTQARADVVTIVSTDEEVDTEWCMVDHVPERTVTFAEVDRCICATPCGNVRCEARVCPASGSMEFVLCEHCSKYVCDCHIYGHSDCGECKHVCDCATCLQLSGLTTTEAAIAMAERLDASGEFGSLREVTDDGETAMDVRDVEPENVGTAELLAQVVVFKETAEELSTAVLLAQGRLIGTAMMRLIGTLTTAVLNETTYTEGVENGQYSPETAPGAYSPSTPSYSSDEDAPVRQDGYVRARQTESLYGWGDTWLGTSRHTTS